MYRHDRFFSSHNYLYRSASRFAGAMERINYAAYVTKHISFSNQSTIDSLFKFLSPRAADAMILSRTAHLTLMPRASGTPPNIKEDTPQKKVGLYPNIPLVFSSLKCTRQTPATLLTTHSLPDPSYCLQRPFDTHTGENLPFSACF